MGNGGGGGAIGAICPEKVGKSHNGISPLIQTTRFQLLVIRHSSSFIRYTHRNGLLSPPLAIGFLCDRQWTMSLTLGMKQTCRQSLLDALQPGIRMKKRC
jgi:hypothetical protein